MAELPQAFFDDLNMRLDIVSMAQRHMKLEKSGQYYKGRCPFHLEKTPSFFVYPNTSSYYCFGCHAAGSALKFFVEMNNVAFMDAVRQLAREVGIAIPDSNQRRVTEAQKHLYDVLKRADQFFYQNLRDQSAGSHVRSYLIDRGLNGEIMDRFHIGYAPAAWDSLRTVLHDVDEQLLLDADLLRRSEKTTNLFDVFRNRIMFPIRNGYGEVVGFGGRVINPEENPKYLNSRKTPVFDKSSELYGLYEMRQVESRPKEVLLVEGYMDVISLAQNGIHNSVATLGTASNSRHFKRLFGLCDTIVCCFDGDDAGRKAAWRSLSTAFPELRKGKRLHFMFLPEGEDPDSLIRLRGKDYFERLVNNADSAPEYFVQHLTANKALQDAEDSVEFVDEVIDLIRLVPHETMQNLLIEETVALFPQNNRRIRSLLRTQKTHVPTPIDEDRPDPLGTVLTLNSNEKLYVAHLFHSPNIWSELPKIADLLKQLEYFSPNSLLVDMWQRIVTDEIANRGSLLASYSGHPSYDDLMVISEDIMEISAQDFSDSIETLLHRYENAQRRKELITKYEEHAP